MADAPVARDDDRLPWLEPMGEGERVRTRRPVSRTALVGLLVAFLGVGLAIAFSLGYRFARPAAEVPAVASSNPAAAQPERTASVRVPLSPPTPEPRVEQIASPAVAEAPDAEAPKPTTVAAKPTIKKARSTNAKAKKRYAKRKPILRPFINIKKRVPAPSPVRSQPVIPFTPRGRIIQLGAFSTQRQADAAYRSIVWRHPYLASKPKVISPTQPVGGWRYYRLRLGTETQAQSLVICQQLQARGQSCIVIY